MASVRSWSQLVRNADPDFDRESRRPWVYEFSNGRRFLDKPNPYRPYYLLTDAGELIHGDDGWPMTEDG